MKKPKIRTLQCYADQSTVDKLSFIAGHYRRSNSDAMRELIRIEYDRLITESRHAKPDLVGD